MSTTPITTYADAEAALKNTPRLTIAGNTHLRRLGDTDIALTLHRTDVITYHKHSADLTLQADGHVTATTARRLNDYTPKALHVRRSGQEFIITDSTTDTEYRWSGTAPLTIPSPQAD